MKNIRSVKFLKSHLFWTMQTIKKSKNLPRKKKNHFIQLIERDMIILKKCIQNFSVLVKQKKGPQ